MLRRGRGGRGGRRRAPEIQGQIDVQPPQQSRSEQVAGGGQDFLVLLTLNARASPASLGSQDGSTNQAVYTDCSDKSASSAERI